MSSSNVYNGHASWCKTLVIKFLQELFFRKKFHLWIQFLYGLHNDIKMVNRSDLVVIGISVGLALGLLLALLLFFAIKWYKDRSHLRRCANEQNGPTLPVHTAKRGVVIPDDSANTVSLQPLENAAAAQHQTRWNHHNKDLTVSASGIPRYHYKWVFCPKLDFSWICYWVVAYGLKFFRDIQKATQNFTTILGQGSFGPVYKAVMPNGGLAAAKVHASNSSQGDREFHTEVSVPIHSIPGSMHNGVNRAVLAFLFPGIFTWEAASPESCELGRVLCR